MTSSFCLSVLSLLSLSWLSVSPMAILSLSLTVKSPELSASPELSTILESLSSESILSLTVISSFSEVSSVLSLIVKSDISPESPSVSEVLPSASGIPGTPGSSMVISDKSEIDTNAKSPRPPDDTNAILCLPSSAFQTLRFQQYDTVLYF